MNEIILPKDYLSPEEMGQQLETVALKKISYPWLKSFVLAILGGAFIAFGGLLCSIVGAGATGAPYGLIRLLMGIVFSLGLILVVISGAELFTGSTIVSVAVVNKKANLFQLIKNWSTVYLGNFVGAIIIVLLVFFGKQYTFGNGVVGINFLNTAMSKIHHTFGETVSLGILCNLLVCLAIWLSYSTKTISGKIMAIIFPVTAFVAAGFEHSVANMFFIPMAWIIKNFDSSFTANINLADLTVNSFLLKNLLPSTIGNIIGGMAVWLTFNWIHKKHA